MATYSKLLYYGAARTAAAFVYTVPAGITAVLRDLEMLSGTGSADHLVLYADVSGSSPAFFQTPDVGPSHWVQWQGRIVLPAGAQLGCVTLQAQWTLMVSGYELGS